MKCLHVRCNFLKITLFALYIVAVLILLRRKYYMDDKQPQSEVLQQINRLEEQLRNYEARVNPRLGDLGQAAYLEGADKEEGEKALKSLALNTVLCDRIPLNRTISDRRINGCKNLNYFPPLRASVVIIFHNELLSALLRTVWSVILQSPPNLLHEIILVDDANADENLLALLDYYIGTRLKDYNVQILHVTQRQGLIRARLHGARQAAGDVLVFLDAHCEATVGWLEPLLARIQEDRTAVLVPLIDAISPETLAYLTNGDAYQVGGFSWTGNFVWIDVQDENHRGKPGPVKSPTMQGGLFAIDRKYFWEIGAYDEQMDGWGGENLEMSFRIWQCGGRIETVPCSRVGHIYRTFHPYTVHNNKDTFAINTARMVHVWMDDYKRHFFWRSPNYENNPAVGDLTHRKKLREKLQCKSFKWYLDNVYPEKFIPDERVQGFGQVRNRNSCLDDLQLPTESVGPLGLYDCHRQLTASQYFSLTLAGEIRNDEHCAEGVRNGSVILTYCHKWKPEQKWVYRVVDGAIENSHFNWCLSSKGKGSEQGVVLKRCKGRGFQKWSFLFVNATAVGV